MAELSLSPNPSKLKSMQKWKIPFKIIYDFYRSDGLTRSSSLAFTLILSIIPFCITSGLILNAIPGFNQTSDQFLDQLTQQLSPAYTEVINSALHLIQGQAEQLSIFSVIFLFFTSFTMLFTLINHVNEIWDIKNPPSFKMSLVITWLLMLFAPVLFGTSILLNTYLSSVDFIKGASHPLLFVLTHLLAILAFFILYKAIPYTKVRIRPALIGAISIDIMFALAKALFVFYIKHLSTDSVLYGAFVAIPLFMLWIYICSILFLLNTKVVQYLNEYL